MQLSPPTQVTFWASVILVVLGVLGKFVSLALISALSFWLVLAGFVLLAAGNLLKGM
jgi:hypothetical protein